MSLRQKIRVSFSAYFDYRNQSKELRKKIHQYYRTDFRIFRILLIVSISLLIIAYSIVFLEIIPDIILRAIISIGLLYSYLITFPITVIFAERYVIKYSITNSLFYSQYKIEKLIDEIIKEWNIKSIRRFHKELKLFGKNFSFVFGRYVNKYKKDSKSNRLIIRDCFYKFDSILHMITFNVETNSKRTKDLLIDFEKYIDEINYKLVLPIFEGKILTTQAKKFFDKWDTLFKTNYSGKYRDSHKYFKKYVNTIKMKYKHRLEVKTNLIFALIQILSAIAIFVISLIFRFQ